MLVPANPWLLPRWSGQGGLQHREGLGVSVPDSYNKQMKTTRPEAL
jgi:hypothetical protein